MNDISLVDIKAQLSQTEERAGLLQKELHEVRTMLTTAQNRLNKIASQLEKFTGSGTPDENPPRTADGRRLKDYIVRVLQNSNEPLTTLEIADLVKEAGYLTTSKENFHSIVYQTCIRNVEFRKAGRGKTRPVRFTLVNSD